MPKQKLKTPEEWRKEGLEAEPQIFHRSQPQEFLIKKQLLFIRKIQNESVEACADKTDKMSKSGWIRDGEYSGECIKKEFVNLASEIRALITEEPCQSKS